MTIKSQALDFAVSIIAVAGCSSGTCKSSADIPVCSAVARASSSTLPANSLRSASQLTRSSFVGRYSIGDSVTVMTVTLAFKAFAKASPCLTPFLATSDPSVHKRILAYIRVLVRPVRRQHQIGGCLSVRQRDRLHPGFRQGTAFRGRLRPPRSHRCGGHLQPRQVVGI